MRLIALLFLCVTFLGGCYQAHSDDDLRDIPVTNNPLLIQDSQKTAMGPNGMGY